ncbi:hypothetical protein NEUTE1DRAFT_123696 [Neurospora tetrasperma FGSC 2508]|uniref:Uncharacterized protein n=1 Tax=Neurospora tetrasperma (strain FGSC 2508 / ATCC MYA-4615 / P0657) TaxID=510951 RepID=F8MT91_NEUT8|nr:uncharacterized protein NEUTE1DRAFT_123696 [Neurospora tetrasperma FGSC 2508]EGO55223.1 hypothetical protein NEUTE1DRAFT_123696 [Neurospora tetrasperma FGSC 2508]EGZ69559.1 hypothetical protein NEUTE2DRAFT_94840 [Neurospora tetrasperma FGSC 2509]
MSRLLKFRRIIFARQFLIPVAVVYLFLFLTLGPWSPRWASSFSPFTEPPKKGPVRQPTNFKPLPRLQERVPCYGPRGKFLSRSPDDELKEEKLDVAYPQPFWGSYATIGLDQTWMTIDGRYGPYGYGEEDKSYNRSKVDWNKINWGKLQNECFERNRHRFPTSAIPFDNTLQMVRLGYRNVTRIPETRQWHEFKNTRRTAIVVRAWRGYDWKAEDMQNLRSLIVEASLRTGGEYQVVLLVDMKDYQPYIFASDENYEKALSELGIPAEFREIAVLWDDRLLESWYPDIAEHRTMWQVYQPVQLFSLHYPEFDHIWQVELDMRFTGDAGKFLDRMSDFARKEPRKQAFERAMFQQMENKIGDYKAFFDAVNRANKGGAYIWGPLRIPDIDPIGPEPPTELANNEDFKWGVGEDADVIVTSACNNAQKADAWVFKGWLGGFKDGTSTPRFFCPPAITRTSRTLLLAVHEAQLVKGLRAPSEATPSSFALWHGLKLSFPQHPVFWKKEHDDETQNAWWKGGPANSTDGVGPDVWDHPSGMGLTFWWESEWPRQIVDAWMGKELPKDVARPWLLVEKDGKRYVPNMMMHPMKHYH